MTIKPKTTKKPAAKAQDETDASKSLPESKATAAKSAAEKPVSGSEAAPAAVSVEPRRKSGPIVGVLITILIFAGLVAGAGVTWKFWWPYVEPLLPQSDFDSDPRVAQLQDRVEELETQQQEKDSLSESELAAFQKLEKERARISEKLAAAIARLDSVEASVKNVEKMARCCFK